MVDITWFLCVNYILASEGMEVIRKLRLVGVIHFCKDYGMTSRQIHNFVAACLGCRRFEVSLLSEEYFNVWNAIDWLTVLGGHAL